jgi:hypothetical protein
VLQRRGHLAENFLLERIDPLIATRVLAHISAHTGVDIPSLTTPASGSDAPPAVTHARLLAARLRRCTALASWLAVAAVIGGHPNTISQNDRRYRAALTRSPAVAAELDRLIGAVENWHTPTPAHPTTPHHERMRDLAIAITAYAVEMLAPAHGSKIARLAGIAVCREHTDLTNHEISTIRDVDHAQPWLARATAERRGHEDADFARGYRLLIDHAQALQRQGGYANANLERARQAGHR